MATPSLEHVLCPSEVLDEKCTRSVEVVLPSFSVGLGHVSIQEDSNLWTLTSSALAKVAPVFSLPDPGNLLSRADTLQQILRTIFPDSELAFFSPEEHTEMLSCLEESDRALLLAQAICGLVVVFARLADDGKEITSGLLSKELQLFTDGGQVATLMKILEDCHVFSKCYMKTQLQDAMVDAIQAARRDDIDLPDVNLGVDSQYGIRMSELTARSNMGVPGGFTIMAIN